MWSDRRHPGSSGYVPYAGVPSNGCDQRCSYWYCIRAGSNRSAPGHQTLTPVANQVKTPGCRRTVVGVFIPRMVAASITNAWYEDNGKWYWFDGAGKMVHDVWYQYKGSWYCYYTRVDLCTTTRSIKIRSLMHKSGSISSVKDFHDSGINVGVVGSVK